MYFQNSYFVVRIIHLAIHLNGAERKLPARSKNDVNSFAKYRFYQLKFFQSINFLPRDEWVDQNFSQTINKQNEWQRF